MKRFRSRASKLGEEIVRRPLETAARPTGWALILALWIGGPAGAAGPPPARLPQADAARIYWEVAALCDGGARVFARFIITNQGPGRHTAVVEGNLVHPDGRVRPFTYAKERERWDLSADGLLIEAGSAHLDLHGPRHRLQVRSEKRGIDLVLMLEPLPREAGPAAPAEKPALVVDYAALALASGELRLDGEAEPVALRGVAALRRVWTERDETQEAQRWIDLLGRDGDTVFYAWEVVSPSGGRQSELLVARQGKVVLQRRGIALQAGAGTGVGERAYPLPSRLGLRGDGLSGGVRAGRELLRYDPLAPVPQPFRFLLSIRSKPRRIWADADFELARSAPGDAAWSAAGEALLGVNYLNPWP